ncbi:VOC family protein [Microbacterium nymphoidis]|uniref:VOC family protein n=1 Tax=Microbacterium nymphoidis TaxID=2898586 RepID=UPI001E50AE0A|nr:VOC family protein [Microbacterium nymphoidis]MCD2500151.1 VOC family protein [Microbacterium nymphoidis]
MTINLQFTTVLSDDIPASTAFYRDALGFSVLTEVNYGEFSWVTLGSEAGAPGQIVLTSPRVGVSPEDGETLSRLLAAGSLPQLVLSTDDLDAAYRRAVDAGAEIVQDILEQDYGVRDFALRDPAGTAIRVQQPRG